MTAEIIGQKLIKLGLEALLMISTKYVQKLKSLVFVWDKQEWNSEISC